MEKQDLKNLIEYDMPIGKLVTLIERTNGQYDNFHIYRMSELLTVANKYEITWLPVDFNPTDMYFFFINGEELSDMIVSFNCLCDLRADTREWLINYVTDNLADLLGI